MVIDILIVPDHSGARLYVARSSWCPPMLRDRLNGDLEAKLPTLPDWDDLERVMWDTDSPHEKRLTKSGGAEIRARGRSAVTFASWLADTLRNASGSGSY